MFSTFQVPDVNVKDKNERHNTMSYKILEGQSLVTTLSVTLNQKTAKTKTGQSYSW